MRPPLRSLIGPRGLLSCCAPPFFAPRSRLGGAGGPKLALRSRPPGPGGPPSRHRRPDAGRRSRRRRRAEAHRSRRHRPPGAGRRSRRHAGPRSAKAAATGRTRAEAARTWRRTILARARFAHRKAASLKRLCVEALDDFFGGRSLGELDEREAARSPGLAIDGHHDVRRLGYCGEVGAEVGFARPVGKVPDEQTDCQCSLVKCAADQTANDSIPVYVKC